MRRGIKTKKFSHKGIDVEIRDEEISVEEAKEHVEELKAILDNKAKLIDISDGTKHTLEEIREKKSVIQR